jgi:hypothetical protein
MVLRSHSLWFLPVVLTIISFSSNTAKANAQTTYTFNTSYDAVGRSNFDPSNPTAPEQVIFNGSSTNAPYGLTEFNALSYSQFDPITGSFIITYDPTIIGLEDVSDGYIILGGSNGNQLVGTYSGSGRVNFQNNTTIESGTFTITGGEGIFTGATGTLSAEAFNILPTEFQDPPNTFISQRSFSGSFQTPQAVPESTSVATLVGIGVGASFLLYQRHRKSAS